MAEGDSGASSADRIARFGSGQGFLPPQPPGPEPELGPRPTPAHEPPPGGWQPPAQPQTWTPAPAAPDNGNAVAGFVVSLVSLGLLLVSIGLSSVISVACSIVAIVFSRKGVRLVDAGETPKHRGLGQAGFVIGLVGLVLAVLATIFWIVIAVLLATDEGFRRDFEDELHNSDNIRAAAVVTVTAAVRVLA